MCDGIRFSIILVLYLSVILVFILENVNDP